MKDWIIPTIFLIIGYSLDFTKPWVISLFNKGSLSIRQIRIKLLLSIYKDTKTIRDSTHGALRELANGLVKLTLLVLYIGIAVLLPIKNGLFTVSCFL